MRVYLESLGCRLNAAEIESLARHFAGSGAEVVQSSEKADVIVLNTCAVTAQAVRKSRHRARALRRHSADARLALVGCWATEAPADVAELSGVQWIISNAEKFRTIELVMGQEGGDPLPWEPGRWGHTRAFLAIQEGCNHTCTYCITRVLRGPAHSQPVGDVVATVQTLVAQGAREVVLTGVSLGDYGRDLDPAASLGGVVEGILQDTDLARLRLSSIEPWDVDEILLRQWDNPRLCRQLHIPLQAGVDSVLRRMGRRITTAQFARLVQDARALVPQMAITTDIIVGFPGETAEDFEASLAFVEAMDFARLHVFPYSEREGTPAARLPNRVPQRARRERAARMRTLGRRLMKTYYARFLEQSLPVLWERRDRAGVWRGLTDNYLVVAVESERDLYNTLTLTHLREIRKGMILGEVVPEEMA